MKEARLEDVIDEYFETHEICTMQDLYHFVHDYREKHNVYVPYDHEELEYVLYTLGLDKFYWDPKAEIIRKQEVIICPCCGAKYRKYPDIDKFDCIQLTRTYGILSGG